MSKIIFLSLLITLTTATAILAETATVITKENAIRESCKFFAPVKVKVRYNDSLEIVSKQGDWYKVTFKGIDGCIHKSALEKKALSLSKLVGGKSASSEEVALAGKGFNPQVEKSYKGRNSGLNYGSVSRVQSFGVSESEQLRFIQNGNLNLP